MAIRDLLAARVDLSLRGIISQLVRDGRRLDDPQTARSAAAEYLARHPGRRGNRVSDIHALSRETLSSMRAASRLNSGERLSDARSIPFTESAARSAGERFRYSAIVVVDDPVRGPGVHIPIEITSGTALTRTELEMRLLDAVRHGDYADNYKGRAGVSAPPLVTETFFLTVDRSR